VLRLQQGALQVKGSIGAANPTLDLIEKLNFEESVSDENDSLDLEHAGFVGTIEVDDLEFTYPNAKKFAAKGLNLSLAEGKSVAIVGSSGAGKTTLVDLVLGILAPSSGTVLVSGLAPLDAIKKWPGAIAYVPQDVVITSGTVRENVALGFPRFYATDELIWNALKTAQLDSFVQGLPLGLDSQVGERGAKLSGGQRQRLGIARALFTQPKLIVLDEATSALDGKTELEFSQAIRALHGKVTVVLIAHRLSTVRDADSVVYLKDGEIHAVGNFEEVSLRVPDFNIQSKLME
jgi:ABC-type multidrug transport system fused ATPase/permease subunit